MLTLCSSIGVFFITLDLDQGKRNQCKRCLTTELAATVPLNLIKTLLGPKEIHNYPQNVIRAIINMLEEVIKGVMSAGRGGKEGRNSGKVIKKKGKERLQVKEEKEEVEEEEERTKNLKLIQKI